MSEPHHELGASYVSDAELDAAEVVASYSADEVELHRLARQTLPQLIREVRLHRIEDHPVP